MLDKRTTIILNAINEICTEGSYKIVERNDLLSAFSDKYKVDEDGVAHILEYLADHKYIDIKYSEDGVYCLAPLPEGRMYFENAKSAHTDAVKRKRDVINFTIIGAFLGAFLGSMIAWILTTLIG